jgi:hypothetical protein
MSSYKPQKLGGIYGETDRQQGDIISLLLLKKIQNFHGKTPKKAYAWKTEKEMGV